ncbi:MAG: nucleotidyl transferase AbiEii/AbiGii toxin family protein [Aeromicrobium sp.]|uniref:nucleotidyl transferase AbiEii/AbiGii toxin family protein n=1 Tax=Aeromicrobium sp. TaxID=1871063 RepID=UPI0039E5D868
MTPPTHEAVPSWRASDPDGFADVVVTAARQLGVRPLAVEKDYWACEALRAITVAHPGEVVFKGGTSLEKLRIIRRFSEDLDLLVVGQYGSHRATARALKSMIEAAARATGADASGGRSGGKPGSFHRSAYLAPPLSHSGQPGSIADAAAILVELGQSGGPNPHAARQVTSLLARQLDAAGFDNTAWSDLSPFEVAILHPGRTLIEKLLRINNFASDPTAQEGVHGWPRVGRQFYDAWALLGDDEVLTFLHDRATVAEVLASCYRVSRAFTPDLPVPDGGFAASPAFNGEGPLTGRLRAEHDAAMDGLYYGTDTPPTFDEVLERIHANSSLLTTD